MGKDPPLLPYTYTLFSIIVALLLHLQYYYKCEPMILKMWVEKKFVLWQPCYYNLLTEKKDKEILISRNSL